MPPSAYRSGGKGIDIRYVVRDTEFGTLLVASTPRGVCAVALGDSADTLESPISAKEFPEAHRRQVTRGGTTDDDRFLGWIDAILAHLNGRQARLSVPTDVAATAFQRRVWRELQRIPYGETRTYPTLRRRSAGRPPFGRSRRRVPRIPWRSSCPVTGSCRSRTDQGVTGGARRGKSCS